MREYSPSVPTFLSPFWSADDPPHVVDLPWRAFTVGAFFCQEVT